MGSREPNVHHRFFWINIDEFLFDLGVAENTHYLWVWLCQPLQAGGQGRPLRGLEHYDPHSHMDHKGAWLDNVQSMCHVSVVINLEEPQVTQPTPD